MLPPNLHLSVSVIKREVKKKEQEEVITEHGRFEIAHDQDTCAHIGVYSPVST